MEKTGFEVNPGRIKKQLEGDYNVIGLHYGQSTYKADFIITRDKILRREGLFLGLKTHYESPEPLILAKLRMIKATRPESKSFKDREDIKAIVAVTKVDRRKILRESRKEATLGILKELLDW